MNVTVILPAAGRGSRFSAGGAASASKLEFEIDHRPVFLHAIYACRSVGRVGRIVLAVAPDRVDEYRFRFGEKLDDLGVRLVAGGEAERWETVKRALGHVGEEATHIAVHDAARPCLTTAQFDRLLDAAERYPAVVPGLPVSDTLKRVGPPEASEAVEGGDPLDAILGPESSPVADARAVLETVPREGLMSIQTPQVFEASLLRRAYAGLDTAFAGSQPTDDAALVEALGEAVYVIPGDAGNLKITHPGDAELAAALMRSHAEAAATRRAERELFGDDGED